MQSTSVLRQYPVRRKCYRATHTGFKNPVALFFFVILFLLSTLTRTSRRDRTCTFAQTCCLLPTVPSQIRADPFLLFPKTGIDN